MFGIFNVHADADAWCMISKLQFIEVQDPNMFLEC